MIRSKDEDGYLTVTKEEHWTWKYEKRCAYCNHVFDGVSPTRRYCSYKCWLGAYNKRRRDERLINNPKRGKICVYNYCKKPFRFNRIDQKFCSDACRQMDFYYRHRTLKPPRPQKELPSMTEDEKFVAEMKLLAVQIKNLREDQSEARREAKPPADV